MKNEKRNEHFNSDKDVPFLLFALSYVFERHSFSPSPFSILSLYPGNKSRLWYISRLLLSFFHREMLLRNKRKAKKGKELSLFTPPASLSSSIFSLSLSHSKISLIVKSLSLS